MSEQQNDTRKEIEILNYHKNTIVDSASKFESVSRAVVNRTSRKQDSSGRTVSITQKIIKFMSIKKNLDIPDINPDPLTTTGQNPTQGNTLQNQQSTSGGNIPNTNDTLKIKPPNNHDSSSIPSEKDKKSKPVVPTTSVINNPQPVSEKPIENVDSTNLINKVSINGGQTSYTTTRFPFAIPIAIKITPNPKYMIDYVIGQSISIKIIVTRKGSPDILSNSPREEMLMFGAEIMNEKKMKEEILFYGYGDYVLYTIIQIGQKKIVKGIPLNIAPPIGLPTHQEKKILSLSAHQENIDSAKTESTTITENTVTILDPNSKNSPYRTNNIPIRFIVDGPYHKEDKNKDRKRYRYLITYYSEKDKSGYGAITNNIITFPFEHKFPEGENTVQVEIFDTSGYEMEENLLSKPARVTFVVDTKGKL